jgi:MATE family multidrug resistance protein
MRQCRCLGAVDTAVIGQLGDAAQLGAVGLGAVILATLYWAFGFLRMSTSGLAAQAQGAGEVGESAAVLFRALIIAGTAGARAGPAADSAVCGGLHACPGLAHG